MVGEVRLPPDREAGVQRAAHHADGRWFPSQQNGWRVVATLRRARVSELRLGRLLAAFTRPVYAVCEFAFIFGHKVLRAELASRTKLLSSRLEVMARSADSLHPRPPTERRDERICLRGFRSFVRFLLPFPDICTLSPGICTPDLRTFAWVYKNHALVIQHTMASI